MRLGTADRRHAASDERLAADPRNIRHGLVIPDEGYCDQPYVVVTNDGHWLCTLTTGRGAEGQRGQHVVSTISHDHGRSWSGLVDIEPADGPEASWVVPLVTPAGRVYVFYDYNGDRIEPQKIGNKTINRLDMLGWYVYKYSDDHGRTWSKDRYRLPVRTTACDLGNDFKGAVQILWGIDKPKIHDGSVFFGFTKLGQYMLEDGEGWFFRSDNILVERDVCKIAWQMLPQGDHGLRNPEFGSVQEEHNTVSLSNGDLYCIYRTTMGHPCHAYSRDGGRTWTRPELATYSPGGRLLKHCRACPKLFKTASGRFLLWFHNHGGKDYNGRNPAWVCGGIEKEGYIHWSQPEILLYDPDPATRMSYPDLIEQDGRTWVTETQKTIARVHEVDPTLLEGLWSQGAIRTLSQQDLVLSLDPVPVQTRQVEAPRLPNLTGRQGFTLDLWITFDDLGAGQVILDSRNAGGKGISLCTTDAGTLRLDLSDGITQAGWDCDPGVLKPKTRHHVTVIVDAGPRMITFVVDGVLCDGGAARPCGWARFPTELGSINGSDRLFLGAALRGTLHSLRIYDRSLRTSEAIANDVAGRVAAKP